MSIMPLKRKRPVYLARKQAGQTSLEAGLQWEEAKNWLVVTVAGPLGNAWGLGPLEPRAASWGGERGSGVTQQKILFFTSRVREFFLPENAPTTAAYDKIWGGSSKQPLSGIRTFSSVFVDMKVTLPVERRNQPCFYQPVSGRPYTVRWWRNESFCYIWFVKCLRGRWCTLEHRDWGHFTLCVQHTGMLTWWIVPDLFSLRKWFAAWETDKSLIVWKLCWAFWKFAFLCYKIVSIFTHFHCWPILEL